MKNAFSLIELLVVLAIIGILAVLAVPSLNSILGGSRINLGVEAVTGTLTSARQLAAAKSSEVEIRLIEMRDPSLPSSTPEIRAIQILEIRDGTTNSVGKVRVFPAGVIVGSAPAKSSICDPSILNQSATANDQKISGVGTDYKYRSFRFRPDGSMNLKALLPPSVTNYFLTVYDEKDGSQWSGNTPPANFAAIQLEPTTGTTVLYRP